MTVLGIDIGTTALKCVAFDDDFNIVSEAVREYPLINTDEGVEQDPDAWWDALTRAVKETSADLNISAIGISSQGISFVPVDKNGKALMKAVTWLDMRASEECGFIENHYDSKRIFNITGKRINPAYTLPKLMWIKRNRPGIYKNTHKFLTAHDYIINRLCGAFVTEDSLASGTMAYDITKKAWDRDILKKMDIDISKLPEIKPSGTEAGQLTEKAAAELGLSADVPVHTGGQDQKCAAYGAGISKGTVTVSLGTSAAITALQDKPVLIEDMSLPCFPFIDGESWVLEGFASTAGASVKWFRDNLAAAKSYREIDEAIEAGYDSPDNVMFFPYLEGTGSPEWFDAGGGGFYGIGLGTAETDMARAVLESIAFAIKANLVKIESTGRNYDALSVFGGGAYSNIWLRIIADATGKTVVVPKIRETACLGAALKCRDTANRPAAEKIIEPDRRKQKYYEDLYINYKKIEKKMYG